MEVRREEKNIQLTLIVSSFFFSGGGPWPWVESIMKEIVRAEIEMRKKGETYLHNLDY